jgi:hypothetical protein
VNEIVLNTEQKADLDWLYLVYTWDIRDNDPPDMFGSVANVHVATTAPELQKMGLVSENPLEKGRYYINQIGADYLGKGSIVTPFDTSELAALRGENAQLKQRVKDLETILATVNEPVGRDVTAELGHVCGLDMLQWLNEAWKHDVINPLASERLGVRFYTAYHHDALIQLASREYVMLVNAACWITDSGRDYLATLKSEVQAK